MPTVADCSPCLTSCVRCCAHVRLYLGWTFWLGSGIAPQPDRHQSRIRCKDCGGELRVIGMTNAEGRIICRVLPDHATKFLDSG